MHFAVLRPKSWFACRIPARPAKRLFGLKHIAALQMPVSKQCVRFLPVNSCTTSVQTIAFRKNCSDFERLSEERIRPLTF